MITAIWAAVEERTKGYVGYEPTWAKEELEAAKSIARGGPPTLPPKHLHNTNDFVEYVHDFARISEATGVKFTPSRAKAHEIGMDEISREFGDGQADLAKAVAKMAPLPTGQTLHQALGSYRRYIDRV